MSGEKRINETQLLAKTPAGPQAIVARFVEAWRSGRKPRIDEYLDETAAAERKDLFECLAQLDVKCRLQAGEVVTLADYETLYPKHRETLREIFAQFVSDAADKTVVSQETAYQFANPAATPVDPTLGSKVAAAPPVCGSHTEAPLGLIGDYELLDVLGKGGMGIVYRARQRLANRIVALKVVRSDQLDDLEAIERFKAEAQAAARLDHPHMVTVYEVGFVDGRHFFSMRYVEGKSLAQLLAAGPLENRRAAQYLEPVARAVHEAHLHGVLHRDLKPANILVEAKTDRPLVADFGLAKMQEQGVSQTRAGEVFGSPPYMSPEQTVDAASVTTAADVYSLGATLFHLLAGRPPFQGATVQATLRQVLEQDPVRPRSLNPAADRDLETICLKCLEKQPLRRYASAEDVANELARYLRGEPIHARPLNTLNRAARWCRRKPIAAGLVAATLVAVLAVGTALLLMRQVQNAREKTERAEQLAAATSQFDRFADASSIDTHYLRRGRQLADKIGEFDAAGSTAARGRLKQRYISSIQEAELRPRLSDADYGRLRAAIDELATVDQTAAAELGARLEHRQRQWREVFDLRAPFANRIAVFEAAQVSQKLAYLERADVLDGTSLFTKASASENVEVEATFAPNWSGAREIGLLLGSPASDRQRVSLVLKTRVPAQKGPAPSFDEARKLGQNIDLEIRRGNATIQRRSVAARDLIAGPLHLRGRREGQQLTLQVNSLPPLVAEEIFMTPGHDADVMGLVWPREASLERLHGSRQVRAVEASPLERGDELFAAGDLASALEHYQVQAQGTADTGFQQEARFKQGLCLAELQRGAEARPIFERLAGESGSRWPLLAATQSWLLVVRERRTAESDAILESLSTQFRFEELAAQVPAEVRQQILEGYEQAYGSGYATVRRDPHRVRNMERLLAVAALLDKDDDRQIDARFSLALACFRDGRFDDARAHFQTLRTGNGLSEAGQRDVLEYLVWIYLNQKRPREAQALLDQVVAARGGRLPREMLSLLIDRARVHGALDAWDQAAQDLDLYFRVSTAKTAGFYEACLVRGFVRQKLGDEAGAMESWQQGFRAARDHDALNVMPAAMMASLSGELTRDDAHRLIAKASSHAGDSPALSFMSKKLLADDLIHTVPLNTWRTPRGHEQARRIALHESSLHESYYLQVLLTAYEFWRQAVVGTADPTVLMSTEQDAVVWKLNEEMYAAYEAGTFTELQLLPIALTYKGTTNVFGWAGIAPTLAPEIRGPLAYIFGRQCKHAKKTKEAEMFFKTALRDSVKNAVLGNLAQTELNELVPTQLPE